MFYMYISLTACLEWCNWWHYHWHSSFITPLQNCKFTLQFDRKSFIWL